jgi:simple sugar transport system substrate-binding protein
MKTFYDAIIILREDKSMNSKMMRIVGCIIVCFILFCTSQNSFAAKKEIFTFGLLLVGPYNDHGWSQAHFEAGGYIQSKVPGTKMIYIDKVNPADRPGVTIPQLVDDMVENGAKLIIANSDDMKDGVREAAIQHPKVHFIHVSGDDVLTKKAPKNLSNVMGKMEYGKMMAGFAAAMTTKTGKIGYLGPLINDETRRLSASCYLGAKYAWVNILKKDPKDLKFHVNWIGFWFNIPGVTSDPTQVSHNFFNTGYDVIVSGIDTTEAVVTAKQKKLEGKTVWAIPYDYLGACKGASDVCLGVPYFNWGPSYVNFIKESMSGNWKSKWVWLEPDWENINNLDTSAVGFLPGPAFSSKLDTIMESFIKDLGSKKIQLFKGPLRYQGGETFLKTGEVATDRQIWYMKKLLEGMTGQSSSE